MIQSIKKYFVNLYNALLNDAQREIDILESELEVLQNEYDLIIDSLPKEKPVKKTAKKVAK
jgi:hypothetical protein